MPGVCSPGMLLCFLQEEVVSFILKAKYSTANLITKSILSPTGEREVPIMSWFILDEAWDFLVARMYLLGRKNISFGVQKGIFRGSGRYLLDCCH